MPAIGAIASICAATAVSGVVGGMSWLSYVIVSVVVVVATGTALRAVRVPAGVIWLGQAFVLLCLTVTLFTSSGFLVVLPGPTAVHDLGLVFTQAGSEVQNGVPPVAADQPILCLVVMSIGLVGIAVDTLAVTARVPAAAGLILLCVYAVPASLDDGLLPWWSFVLGAAAFTAMLAVDGVRRHQAWRGKLGLPAVATTGVAPATLAVTTVAALLALFVGGTFTVIGTVGRLPGADGSGGPGTGQLGIKPFTVLQGMLGDQGTTELFDVSGLPATPPYLQALTLDKYQPGTGWLPDTQMPAGVTANGGLPAAPGQQSDDRTTKVTVHPVNWQDVWLPVFGMPTRLQGVSSDYRYDRGSGIVYSEKARQPGDYTEQADLTEPSATALRDDDTDYSQVNPKYLTISGISPRVTELARQITQNATTEFDKAQAIYTYFRTPANGFTYSTQTANPVTGDPLVDFLFYGKTGFCEQYASAMGVMLRSIGIPTRVAIGFTDGYESGDHRIITSQDAHAWDEVYFPSYGWITFDPTPLSDGRAQVPGYLSTPQNSGTGNGAARQNPDGDNPKTSTAPTTAPTTRAPVDTTRAAGAGRSSSVPGWQVWTALLFLLAAGACTVLGVRDRRSGPAPGRHWFGLAVATGGIGLILAAGLLSWWLSVLLVVLGIAAAPIAVREIRRRQRHRAVTARGPDAAGAAWDELLAESWDRGTVIPRSETLRVAAHRMAREHDLDDEGRESLRTLVGEVERSWYGAPRPADPTPTPPVVVESFDRVRQSLHRNAPLALWAKLLPKSVLRPAKRRTDTEDDEDSDRTD
jgi:transglutaminase-like putative cysteine protease